ncbi:efflux RND transporter periplasmic adaptor subunit [Halieaceae bacterium IMCC14734]|uniref:Efflux RND transporter periplasmic adaptor subunit n=1 Tax=Candidatus Litorirhabdus singularis TaxID=2518993 RepID=A0ABT3TL61_9GAMM|nr:efflux RND transporter periplasmic adaptor subunit [Candidatus Litorirhabdus singularis]MCX2983068.1 efflux RND transporter periplasmic adaptor subunit [Candidatus Litorirhabdus singularis]
MGKLLGKVLLFVCSGLILQACGAKQEEAGPAPVRPVKIFEVEGGSSEALRNFPGTVDASQRAEVGFRVGGVLQELQVREGDLVESGQVLARLDPTDFKIILEDRTATFENAERNFERAKELIVDGNISKFDYDRMEANYKTSAASLSQAEQDLAYTELKAPFAGRIARRDVENFEEVIAKQTVVLIQNVGQLDVRINLPESLVRSFSGEEQRRATADSIERRGIKAYADFEGRSGNRFELHLKEVATKADSQTQTFQVTFTMPSPEKFAVLPGMTANVLVDFANIMDSSESKWVPLTAVQADSGLQARVWVLDTVSMTVSSRAVVIGRMAGSNIEVRSGLSGGEKIVAVGAAYLAEGMPVTLMETSEQAIPRDDESA